MLVNIAVLTTQNQSIALLSLVFDLLPLIPVWFYLDKRFGEPARQKIAKEEAQAKWWESIGWKLDAIERAKNFMKAGNYEQAARTYEEIGMWEEAGQCRRTGHADISSSTNYVISSEVKVGPEGISMNCPHCGSSEHIQSKSSEVVCKHCGRKYYIPKNILDMI